MLTISQTSALAVTKKHNHSKSQMSAYSNKNAKEAILISNILRFQ